MALPNVGNPISMSQVNTELSRTSTQSINLNESAVRSLFQKTGAQAISLYDGYGKSACPPNGTFYDYVCYGTTYRMRVSNGSCGISPVQYDIEYNSCHCGGTGSHDYGTEVSGSGYCSGANYYYDYYCGCNGVNEATCGGVNYNDCDHCAGSGATGSYGDFISSYCDGINLIYVERTTCCTCTHDVVHAYNSCQCGGSDGNSNCDQGYSFCNGTDYEAYMYYCGTPACNTCSGNYAYSDNCGGGYNAGTPSCCC